VHSSAISTPAAFQGSSAVPDRSHLMGPVPQINGIAGDFDLAETAMDGIEAQQVGIGLDRGEIVDRHHLDVLAAGLDDGPQDIAADAAKPVMATLTDISCILRSTVHRRFPSTTPVASIGKRRGAARGRLAQFCGVDIIRIGRFQPRIQPVDRFGERRFDNVLWVMPKWR